MRHADKIRQLIAREAARLMYEEGIREYRDAKRKASKPFGSEKTLSLGSHLPSNVEIHDELQRLVESEGTEILSERLLRLRLAALTWMELFTPFDPRLIGSVLTGSVTERSDIDLHLFADDTEEVELFLRKRSIPFERENVTIRKDGKVRDYTHLYIDDDGVIIECSIYPLEDRRRVSKSSITGRPMEYAGVKKIRRLVEDMVSEKES